MAFYKTCIAVVFTIMVAFEGIDLPMSVNASTTTEITDPASTTTSAATTSTTTSGTVQSSTTTSATTTSTTISGTVQSSTTALPVNNPTSTTSGTVQSTTPSNSTGSQYSFAVTQTYNPLILLLSATVTLRQQFV
ncbi:uncharacterized protein LOC125665610 [Ostrea edulis]|uniref:uncharacterized protein LOC125665610 n=1 Tax=Ostrea edulis TaxID=37623 RepID=UPI0024AEA686|nr:uncharacterized protein LOC125665610 [Ostrea edulis]